MSNPTEEQLKWELKRALEEIERLKTQLARLQQRLDAQPVVRVRL